jgi:hypothetical protein
MGPNRRTSCIAALARSDRRRALVADRHLTFLTISFNNYLSEMRRGHPGSNMPATSG